MADYLNQRASVSGVRENDEPEAEDNLPEEDEKLRERIKEQVKTVVGKLEVQATEQVGKKTQIEERWLLDLRQYHGRYDNDTESKIAKGNKSRVFANITRHKTSAWEARLADMLFPTDDKNWGIEPTPIPELADTTKIGFGRAKQMADQATAKLQAGDAAGAEEIAAQGNEAASQATAAQGQIDEAKKRAKAMENEIDDQLNESRFNQISRRAIHDSCKIGTGVLKGPVRATKIRPSWAKRMIEGATSWEYAEKTDPRPTAQRVDPWNYFPDMSAAVPEEREFDYERHLMGKKELRKLAKQPDFDQNAIRRLLESEPMDALPPYWGELRSFTDGSTSSLESKYLVWEYHGPLEHEDVVSILTAGQDHELLEEIKVDPLEEYMVIIWFCQGELLKFGPHPLGETGDSLYSIFNFEKDETSVFGFGVPYMMRDSQAALNGAWRMMMDNAGLSVGPQIVVDSAAVDPADGKWEFTPRKVWKKIKAVAKGEKVFEIFNIPNNQVELNGVIERALQFIDQETNMPLIAEGSEGQHQGKTMGGMSILMNAANVVFRRVVKNFDDDFTTPTIRRFYDWNMKFNPKEEIKGDYDVDARGSSVLLVRELQAQNLMAMVGQFSAHPVLGRMMKIAAAFRKLVQAHMLKADELVKTDEELQADADREAAKGPEKTPEQIRAESQERTTLIDAKARVYIAELNHQTAMMTLAEKRNMTVEELANKIQIKEIEVGSKERIFAGEAAMTSRRDAQNETADTAGGYL